MFYVLFKAEFEIGKGLFENLENSNSDLPKFLEIRKLEVISNEWTQWLKSLGELFRKTPRHQALSRISLLVFPKKNQLGMTMWKNWNSIYDLCITKQNYLKNGMQLVGSRALHKTTETVSIICTRVWKDSQRAIF